MASYHYEFQEVMIAGIWTLDVRTWTCVSSVDSHSTFKFESSFQEHKWL